MLVVENLSFSYRFRPIFRDLSFKVRPGELFHIVGPNGCGKTTLMSVLSGLKQASSGTIQIENHKSLREQVEYLPAEANALYGKMDAIANLNFWMRLRGLRHNQERILQELKLWELDHPLIRQGFPVEKFSTGMKRRLAIARVHLSQTKCWLLDEPFYGLDTKGIETFQNILQEHLDQKGYAIVVSHETQALMPFSPQVLEMSRRAPK